MKRFLLGLLVFVIVAGAAALLLVPTVGSQYRLWREADAVQAYRSTVSRLDTLDCGTLLAQARSANGELKGIALQDPWSEGDAPRSNPGAQALDVADNGVIAVLAVSYSLYLIKRGATVPVLRTFDAASLEKGAVHLPVTSLPVGGESTHCVLAGQGDGRFLDPVNGLDRLIPGDCFYVEALQDTLIYEVSESLILAPSELDALTLDRKADQCTLIAAPSEDERLVVRAMRIGRRQTPLEDDTQVLPGWAARLIFAAPLALAGLIVLALIEGLRRAATRRRRNRMQL